MGSAFASKLPCVIAMAGQLYSMRRWHQHMCRLLQRAHISVVLRHAQEAGALGVLRWLAKVLRHRGQGPAPLKIFFNLRRDLLV